MKRLYQKLTLQKLFIEMCFYDILIRWHDYEMRRYKQIIRNCDNRQSVNIYRRFYMEEHEKSNLVKFKRKIVMDLFHDVSLDIV